MKLYTFPGMFLEYQFDMIQDAFPVVPLSGMSGKFYGRYHAFDVIFSSSPFLNGTEIEPANKVLFSEYHYQVLHQEKEFVL